MLKFSTILLLICLITVLFSCNQHVETEAFTGFRSWKPAVKWENAMLSGNGTIGLMDKGNPYEESLILNHALLFIPNEKPVIPPDMTPYLDKIKKWSIQGRFEDVAKLGVKIWKDAGYGEKKWTDPFVPAGDLNLKMPAKDVTNYVRMVNYETAEAMVKWTDNTGMFSRKSFVSRADSIVVTQIKGDVPFEMEIGLGKHPNSWEQNSLIQDLIKESFTTIEDSIIHYHVTYRKPHSHSPDGYDAFVRVVAKNGNEEFEGNQVKVTGASEILLFTTIKPYKSDNAKEVFNLKNQLRKVTPNYTVLLNRQKKVHGELYNRVHLNLFLTKDEEAMFSETLVKRAKENTSPGIMQRQFEAARYIILCATGINPPNLQGIWSGTWTPPWCSDFTHDGNVEVAISNLLNGNMPELMHGYFNHHLRNLKDYRVNAKQLYGVKGIHVPSHTSSHGYNNHYDDTWCMEYWNGGAGWAASYFYDYFEYTKDTTFLKNKAFPFITEALDFWKNMLTEEKDGKFVITPSYSPENNPLEHRWQNCVNATMDVMIIKELCINWMTAAKILGKHPAEINDLKKWMAKLPDYQIGEDGVLKEWLWPGLTDNQTHRHASHLYGLYEVPDPEIMNSPELENAALKTIQERMKIRKQQQGGEMAFGMCHLGFASVNLGDENTAYEILSYLSRFYWTNGMATYHNPGNLFNVDICGGFPSLLTRMIVNSYPGELNICQALPTAWNKGEITGVLARGNITVKQVKWDDHSIKVIVNSPFKQSLKIHSGVDVDWNSMNVDGADFKLNENSIDIDLNSNKDCTLEFRRV